MSKNSDDSYLPKNTEPQPGAEVTLRTNADGDVSISYSDGSEQMTMSRRDFMRVSGVAAATAAMAGVACRGPAEEIVPYVDRPEEIRIGMVNAYATVCTACPAQCGVLAKTRAGRPFKLEGNPSHPVSQGALCARGQASYMDLYDPDRLRTPMRVTKERQDQTDWETLDTEVQNKAREIRKGGGLRILTGAVSGSARAALIADIVAAVPNTRHYAYEPLSLDSTLVASQASYGEAHVPQYRFDRADVIVSFGSDFLGTWLSPVEFTRQFASRRDPDANMSRFVTFESGLSLTGVNADDRYRVRPNDLVYVAMGVAHEVVNAHRGGFATAGVISTLAPFSPEAVAESIGGDITADIIRKTASELAGAPGRGLVVAGGLASATETGVALETVVNLINAVMGNDGQTVNRGRSLNQTTGQLADLKALLAEIEAGNVDMLIIDEANPVYSAPPELNVAATLAKVPFIVSTSQRLDETSVLAHYVAAGNHYLESWGDSNPRAGVYAIQQPTIEPLYSTRAMEESLLVWFGAEGLSAKLRPFLAAPPTPAGNRPGGKGRPFDPGAWYRYVRHHWENTIYPQVDAIATFEEFWQTTLRAGSWTSPQPGQAPSFRPGPAVALLPSALPAPEQTNAGDLSNKKLHLFASIPMYDGRQANNGHLQELPDPVSRHTWGSYVMVSYHTFVAAKLKSGQLVRIKSGDAEHTFPVLVQPGLHDDVVAIPLGYGRTRGGVVANDVGANGFRLSRSGENGALLSGVAVSITATPKVEPLTVIKGAGVVDIDYHRILATTSLAAYKKDASVGTYATPSTENLWPDHDFGDLRWGMAIDMSKCTGCSACVTACQEENNIPVVGANGILEGREMSWLRMDRYYVLPEAATQGRGVFDDPMYKSDPQIAFGEHLDRPRIVFQPMLCQHCDNAPCETVCPVLATMQSSDGLNQMAYNRCVGTRYCANNCPYKVRRYNWFNYSEDRGSTIFARLYPELKEHGRLNQHEPLTLSRNPDVTVRTRGVMEKCTFCVQRIRRGKWQLMKEGRRLFRDGEVVTACQQACPAGAIEFGNRNDPESRVSRLHNAERAMFALSDLNTKSAIAYLTHVWNTEDEIT